MITITYSDIIILIVYLILILGAGFYFSQKHSESSVDYFLAGRNVGWVAIGLSLFAANISSEHFIGLAGYGASRGLAVGNFEWMAIIFIMILGWFLAPLFLRSKVFTVPEFLGHRFNASTRIYLSTISIVAYLIVKISVTLFAGSLLLEKIFGLDIYVSAIIIVVITGVYTIVGGMGAVIYTSVIQSVFLLLGAIILTIIGLNEVGGISGLQAKLPPSYFDLFNRVSDPDIPWTGIVFGGPILAIWYWCTDQYIVQRILCARDIDAARNGTILTGFLKILPVFILVLPGLVAAALYPGIEGNGAYSSLIAGSFIPIGLRGFIIAGLLAALMSSLAASFNSAATLFTMDIYRSFRSDVSEMKLVLVGRLATTVMVVLAILCIPLTKHISSHIYVFLQSIQAFISPPIAAVFVIGLLWKKANAKGAIFALLIGGLISAFRLSIALLGEQSIIQYGFLQWILSINYLHFAIFLFVISSLVLIIVSLLYEEEHRSRIKNFMFLWKDLAHFNLNGRSTNVGIAVKRNTLVFTVLLFIILIGLWLRIII